MGSESAMTERLSTAQYINYTSIKSVCIGLQGHGGYLEWWAMGGGGKEEMLRRQELSAGPWWKPIQRPRQRSPLSPKPQAEPGQKASSPGACRVSSFLRGQRSASGQGQSLPCALVHSLISTFFLKDATDRSLLACLCTLTGAPASGCGYFLQDALLQGRSSVVEASCQHTHPNSLLRLSQGSGSFSTPTPNPSFQWAWAAWAHSPLLRASWICLLQNFNIGGLWRGWSRSGVGKGLILKFLSMEQTHVSRKC